MLDCGSSQGWRLLMLQRFWDDHADFVWTTNGNNDEDGWRTAITATGMYHFIGPADGGRIAFVCRHEGRPYVVHRCRSKMWPGGVPNRYDGLPLERRAFEIFDDLEKKAAISAGKVLQRRCESVKVLSFHFHADDPQSRGGRAALGTRARGNPRIAARRSEEQVPPGRAVDRRPALFRALARGPGNLPPTSPPALNARRHGKHLDLLGRPLK